MCRRYRWAGVFVVDHICISVFGVAHNSEALYIAFYISVNKRTGAAAIAGVLLREVVRYISGCGYLSTWMLMVPSYLSTWILMVPSTLTRPLPVSATCSTSAFANLTEYDTAWLQPYTGAGVVGVTGTPAASGAAGLVTTAGGGDGPVAGGGDVSGVAGTFAGTDADASGGAGVVAAVGTIFGAGAGAGVFGVACSCEGRAQSTSRASGRNSPTDSTVGLLVPVPASASELDEALAIMAAGTSATVRVTCAIGVYLPKRNNTATLHWWFIGSGCSGGW